MAGSTVYRHGAWAVLLGCLHGLVACSAEAPSQPSELGEPASEPGAWAQGGESGALTPSAKPASATTTSTTEDEPAYVADDGEEQDSEPLEAGGMGGAEHSADLASTSEGGSGGGDALEPSCESLPDGSYCGSELTSPGASNELFQCVDGLVTAAARCPGSCQQGACSGSTGTSSGSGHGKGK